MHAHVRLILWKHITSSDQAWSHIARHEWVTVRTQIIRPHVSTLELPLLIRSGSFSFLLSEARAEGVSFRCAQLRTLVPRIRSLWVCHIPERARYLPSPSPPPPLPLLNVRKTITQNNYCPPQDNKPTISLHTDFYPYSHAIKAPPYQIANLRLRFTPPSTNHRNSTKAPPTK